PWAMPHCKVESEYPLTYPGATIAVNISYSSFLFPSPIVVLCRPNSLRFCFVAPGSGSCAVSCDYPYKGTYTITATSLTHSCQPFLVVADPNAKPSCTLTPDTARGNGTFSTLINARFSNILPNTTEAQFDCGNGEPPKTIAIIGKSIHSTCQYSAEGKKEVYSPNATAGGATCSAQIVAIPTSDSIPPQVSFYNLTYRFAINSTYNVSIIASDNVEVERVELYINESLAKTMRTPPYYYVLDVGKYNNGTGFMLQARAYDIYGNTNVTPQYLVTRAVEGERSCNITVKPRYSPIPAQITLVAVFHNTSSDVLFAYFQPHYPGTDINKTGPLTPITNGTASTTLGYSTAGTYAPYVTDGNVTCRTTVYITAVPDTTPPTVSLSSPKQDQNIWIGDTIELTASASDNLLVDNVEYYLGTRLIANSSSSPFNSSWNTSGEHIGFYDLSAISHDIAGNPSIFPSKARVLLYTNRTCSISPRSATIQQGVPTNFSVTCFNYTTTNFTQATTNRTTTNFTENFTISSQDIISTMLTKITCPEMDWSSTLSRSKISPIKSSSLVTFAPQDTEVELSGVITATDSVSGISCTSNILIVKEIPACEVSLDSPSLVGSSVPVTILYENLSRPQEFRIICRPNQMVSCYAAQGSGLCTAYCDYPSTGRYSVGASSPSITCRPKSMSVFPHPDTYPPVISITRPFNRQILTGINTIEAYAVDNFGVERVVFLVDSKAEGSDETSPYMFVFNTTGARNGDHTITAMAYDETGNIGEYSITVTVAN
ncbi:MAG: Ig-like domain-containing protein, partial [Candidatus Micrarchaeota archaeon]